jgi:hypothetical protein
MLYKEIIALCSGIHTKQTNEMGRKAKIFTLNLMTFEAIITLQRANKLVVRIVAYVR